jgi:uncharacterized protein (TIGR02996 family)
MIMNDHKAFADAINANPQDNAIHLVYADWLEEQGQTERAEYLRIASELKNELDQQTREKFRQRLTEIFQQNPSLFRFSLLTQYSAHPITTDRGIIDRIECDLQTWHDAGAQFLIEIPTVRGVIIANKLPLRCEIFEGRPTFCRWGDFVPDEENPRSELHFEIPHCIFDHLIKNSFDSNLDAFQELSDACIRWAKAQNESQKSD